jgi:hypothetical protein
MKKKLLLCLIFLIIMAVIAFIVKNHRFDMKSISHSQSIYIWNGTTIGQDSYIIENRKELYEIIKNEPILTKILQKYLQEEEEYKEVLGIEELNDEAYQNILIKQLKELNIDTVFLNAGRVSGIYKEIKHEIYKDAYSDDKKLNNKELLSEITEKISGQIYLRKNHEKYSNFIKMAGENGITVQALYGSPKWALEKHLDGFSEQINDVLFHNKKYIESRFSAIHLDIEPHTLPEWKENKKLIAKQYINNLKYIRELVDRHNDANEDNLLLIIDIPVNYDESLLNELLDIVDEVTVMNYFNNLKTFVNKGKDILNVVEKYNTMKSSNKKVRIASEFQPYSEIKYNTLYFMSEKEIIKYFKSAIPEFEKFNCFSGIAIHEYESYKSYITKLKKE